MKKLFTYLLLTGFISLKSQTATLTPQGDSGKNKTFATVAKRKQLLPDCVVGANNLRCDLFPEAITFTVVGSKQESASGWLVTAKAPDGISLKLTFSEKPVIKIYESVASNPSSEQVAIQLNSSSESYLLKPGGKVFVNQGTSGFYNITICGFLNVPGKTPRELLSGLVVPPEN